MKSVRLICVIAALAVGPTFGDIMVRYYEDGSSLVFDYSGNLGLSTGGGSTFSDTYISSDFRQIFYSFDGQYSTIYDGLYTETSGSGELYTNSFSKRFGTQTGSTLGVYLEPNIDRTVVFVRRFYTAGSLISGTATIPNTSIADVGIQDATIQFQLTPTLSERISFVQGSGTVAVPEASSAFLLFIAAGASGLLLRRRFKRRSASLSQAA